MSVTSVGLYEVVLEQAFFGQVILNVFHYLSNTSDDDVQELCATAFDEDVLLAVSNIQSTNIVYKTVRANNLTGVLADATVIPSISTGAIVGTVVADFVACAFRYNRVEKATRNGSKRFGGMTEEVLEGGGFTAAYDTTAIATAVVLGTDISTVGGVFTPVILRKPDDGFGNWTYNTIQNVQYLDRVTTQNSRKKF